MWASASEAAGVALAVSRNMTVSLTVETTWGGFNEVVYFVLGPSEVQYIGAITTEVEANNNFARALQPIGAVVTTTKSATGTHNALVT